MDLSNSHRSGHMAKFPAPFEVLTRTFDFADKDQLAWWYNVGPTCAKMMVDSSYSVHQQYEYLCFIYRYIIPVLGPSHHHTGGSALENALVSKMPYEHSINFQGDKSTVRVFIEPASPLAWTTRDPCNKLTIQSYLNRMECSQRGRGIDTTFFYFFADKLLLSEADEVRLRTTDIVDKLSFKSQSSTAFELKDGKVGMKTFMYPMMKSLATGKSVTEVLFDSFRTLPSLHSGKEFMPAISTIKDYVDARTDACADPTTSVFFVGFDMVALDHARIKIYISEAEVGWDILQDMWTLGGRLNSEENAIGLHMLKDIWGLLEIPEGRRKISDEEPTLDDPSTLNQLIVSYEVKAGQADPIPKVYVSLRGYSEAAKCGKMTTLFKHLGWTKHARSYGDNVRSYFPSFDFHQCTTIQSWLSFAFSARSGPYMTMYFHDLDTSSSHEILGF